MRGSAARGRRFVEVDPTEAVRVRGDVHDAGRARCPQAREQEVRQQEVGQVVHREHGLDPVHRGERRRFTTPALFTSTWMAG